MSLCPNNYPSTPVQDKSFSNLAVNNRIVAREIVACRINGLNLEALFTEIFDKLEKECPPTPYLVGPNCPFKTIQSAIDAAVADGASGDNPVNVFIAQGTYTEDLSLYAGVVLVGLGEGRAITTRIIGTHVVVSNTVPPASPAVMLNLACINPVPNQPLFTLLDFAFFAAVRCAMLADVIFINSSSPASFAVVVIERSDVTASNNGNVGGVFDFSTANGAILTRFAQIDAGNNTAFLFNGPTSPATFLQTQNTNTEFASGNMFFNFTSFASFLECHLANSSSLITFNGNTAIINSSTFRNCTIGARIDISDNATVIIENCSNDDSGSGGFTLHDASAPIFLQLLAENSTCVGSVNCSGTGSAQFSNFALQSSMSVSDAFQLIFQGGVITGGYSQFNTSQATINSTSISGITMDDSSLMILTNSSVVGSTILNTSCGLSSTNTHFSDIQSQQTVTISLQQVTLQSGLFVPDSVTLTVQNSALNNTVDLTSTVGATLDSVQINGTFTHDTTPFTATNCVFGSAMTLNDTGLTATTVNIVNSQINGGLTVNDDVILRLNGSSIFAGNTVIGGSAIVEINGSNLVNGNLQLVSGTATLILDNSVVDARTTASNAVILTAGLSAKLTNNSLNVDNGIVPAFHIVNGIAGTLSNGVNACLNTTVGTISAAAGVISNA